MERFLSREKRAFEDTVKKLDDERAALELSRAEVVRKSVELDGQVSRQVGGHPGKLP